jgi:hypothetical protein
MLFLYLLDTPVSQDSYKYDVPNDNRDQEEVGKHG